MDKRKKIIIAVVALLILALILWLIFRPKAKPHQVVNLNTTTTVSNTVVKQMNQLPPADDLALAKEKTYPLGLKQLAMSFAERYGSYSNQADSKNILDLEPQMTQKMIDYVETYLIKGVATTTYQGYDTKAILANVLKLDQSTGDAQIEVKTQRRYYNVSKTSEAVYQNLLLQFKKDGSDWKVDYAKWE